MPIYANIPYRPRYGSIRRRRPVFKKKMKAPTRAVSSYVKSMTGKTKPKGGYKKKSRMSTGMKTSTKKYVRENKSVENQIISLQVPRPRPSVYKLAMASLEPCWFRVQGLTQFDTSSGYFPIAQRILASTAVSYPIHVWSLTSFPNINGAGSLITPNIGYAMGFSGTANTSTVTSNVLSTQTTTGATVANSGLIPENYPGLAASTYSPYRKLYHEWSHVKLNLYGTRSRATRYTCELVQTNDSSAVDFLSGKDPVKQADYVDYLSRPFVFNNILMGDVQSRKYHKVIRRYETTIDPIQTIEFGGSNAPPRIQTVNWFIKHNKIRRYDWTDDTGQSTHSITGTTGANFETNLQGVQTDVDPKQRLYLVIRALAPSVDATKTAVMDAVNPDTEPSYDMCMRQKVQFSV